MENMSLVIGVAQLGITVCSLVLGAVGRARVAHLIEPVLHALARARVACCTRSPSRSRSPSWSSSTWCSARWCPRTSPWPDPDRAALVLGPPIWARRDRAAARRSSCINAVARRLLRLSASSLRTRSSSTYTREEVAALVEESRGEGLLEPTRSTTGSPARSASPRRPWPPVLMRARDARDRPPRRRPRPTSRRCAATGFSRFPVAARRTASSLGYLHIKDVLETDEARRDAGRSTTSGSGRSRRSGSDDPLHDALETLQRRGRAHGPRRATTTGRSSGSPRSRTSSRSWSARSATPPTIDEPA